MRILRIGSTIAAIVASIGASAETKSAPLSVVKRGFPTVTSLQDSTATFEAALARAARDLCGRRVVLLGESGFHGEGKTVAFKVALIQRLVDKCGFTAVFFEANHYDFLAFGRVLRSNGEAAPSMVSSAVGQKWNQSAEFAPLIPYLFDAARSGKVTLGGLDHQLGSRGSFYALEQMSNDLVSYLPGDRGLQCQEQLNRRIRSDFSPDKPYSEVDQRKIGSCLTDIRAAIPASASPRRDKAEDLQKIANFERAIARDFEDVALQISARELSLFSNFQWLNSTLPKSAKVIVWSANRHIAKDASSALGFSGSNFGSLVRQAYGSRSFALGFSAASGSFRWSRQEIRTIPLAPTASLEGKAVSGSRSDVIYMDTARLRALGRIAGGVFDHQYLTAKWSEIVDGAVVFQAERPPNSVE